MGKPDNTFGKLLKETRIEKGFSLRKFAKSIGISGPYVCEIERSNNFKRPPTADRIEKMANVLDVDVDEWLTLAGRISKESKEILHSNPKLPALLRSVKGFTSDQIDLLIKEAERINHQKEL